MQITKVKLTNYRNIDDCDLDLFGGVTLVSGANGQGKTNLVESLVVACTTKSPRTSQASELIRDGKDMARVQIELSRKFGNITIGYTIDVKGEKNFYINSNKVDKLANVFGNLVVIYFCPNDLKIVSASPAERREFMDTDISQLSGSYYNLLQRYNKILMQRNKLLKFEKNREVLLAEIEVFNEQLAHVAALIIKTRKGFIEKLKEPAKNALKYITNSKDELEVEYIGAKGNSFEEIKQDLIKALKYNLERDLELGYTSVGPHRDDIYFALNNKDARSYSSQGQQRSIVLALKFAEMQIFTDEMGESPVLVLDDVFSELDTTRQRKLYEKMQEYQTIITGTVFKFKPAGNFTQVKVKQGVIKALQK